MIEIRRPPSLARTVTVVCEGQSETMYLQELNRFFREYRIPLTFIPRAVGNGACKAVIGHYRSIRKFLRHEEIIIWVDWDIYTSSEAKNYAAKPEYVPDFLFSTMNFEDFLMLHMNEQMVLKWQEMADSHSHFEFPMPAAVYIPIFKTFGFHHYKKGRMPFKLNAKTLAQLFMNLHNKKIRFKNDFGSFVENRLRRMGWLVETEDQAAEVADAQELSQKPVQEV